jgi:hypothetical protein
MPATICAEPYSARGFSSFFWSGVAALHLLDRWSSIGTAHATARPPERRLARAPRRAETVEYLRPTTIYVDWTEAPNFRGAEDLPRPEPDQRLAAGSGRKPITIEGGAVGKAPLRPRHAARAFGLREVRRNVAPAAADPQRGTAGPEERRPREAMQGFPPKNPHATIVENPHTGRGIKWPHCGARARERSSRYGDRFTRRSRRRATATIRPASAS